MLYNEHSVDKFTICSHTQALRHNHNTKNTLHFRAHIMPHKSPKIPQYLRFPSPSWSGSALENIKIPTYSQHIANTLPTLHRIGQSTEHHTKMLYFQSINQCSLYLIILSIHDVISHMIHYNNIISYIQ